MHQEIHVWVGTTKQTKKLRGVEWTEEEEEEGEGAEKEKEEEKS